HEDLDRALSSHVWLPWHGHCWLSGNRTRPDPILATTGGSGSAAPKWCRRLVGPWVRRLNARGCRTGIRIRKGLGIPVCLGERSMNREQREAELREMLTTQRGKEELLAILKKHAGMEQEGNLPPFGTLLVDTILNYEYPPDEKPAHPEPVPEKQ